MRGTHGTGARVASVCLAAVALVVVAGGAWAQDEEPAEAPGAPDAARLAEWVRDLGSQEYEDRQAATEALVGAGMPAIPTLFTALRASDDEIVRRSVYIIAKIQTALIPESERVAKLVRDAMDRLTSKRSFGTGDPEYREILNMGNAAVPGLLDILEDRAVRNVQKIYAGIAVQQLAEEKDVPSLVDLLDHADLHTRRYVGTALQRLVGEAFGYDASTNAENWTKAQEAYREWWKSRQDGGE